MFGFLLASVATAVFLTVRKFLYVSLLPGHAAIGSVLYGMLVMTFSGVLIFNRRGDLNAILLILAGSAALSSIAASLFAWRKLENETKGVTGSEFFRWTFKHSRWTFPQLLVLWIGTAAFAPIASLKLGSAVLGNLRTVENLTLPLNQGLTAIAGLFVPRAQREFIAEGKAPMLRLVSRLRNGMFVGVSFYTILLVAASGIILPLLSNDRQAILAYAWILVPLVVEIALRVLGDVGLAIPLRVAGRYRTLFFIVGVVAILSAGGAWVLAGSFGVVGLFTARLSAVIVSMLLLTLVSHRPGGTSEL